MEIMRQCCYRCRPFCVAATDNQSEAKDTPPQFVFIAFPVRQLTVLVGKQHCKKNTTLRNLLFGVCPQDGMDANLQIFGRVGVDVDSS